MLSERFYTAFVDQYANKTPQQKLKNAVRLSTSAVMGYAFSKAVGLQGESIIEEVANAAVIMFSFFGAEVTLTGIGAGIKVGRDLSREWSHANYKHHIINGLRDVDTHEVIIPDFPSYPSPEV